MNKYRFDRATDVVLRVLQIVSLLCLLALLVVLGISIAKAVL